MCIMLQILLTPKSKRNLCVRDGENIRCYVHASPEKGRANKALIKLISQKLRLAQWRVTILYGHMSRKKVVQIKTDRSKDDNIILLTNIA